MNNDNVHLINTDLANKAEVERMSKELQEKIALANDAHGYCEWLGLDVGGDEAAIEIYNLYLSAKSWIEYGKIQEKGKRIWGNVAIGSLVANVLFIISALLGHSL